MLLGPSETVKLDVDKKEQVRELYFKSFGEDVTNKMTSILHNINSQNEGLFSVVNNNAICSLHGVSYADIVVRGLHYKTYYLYYLVTDTKCRGNGFAKKLFKDIIEKSVNTGIDFIIFDPFSFSFYRRWGAEIGFDNYELVLHKSLLNKSRKRIRLNKAERYYKGDLSELLIKDAYIRLSKKLAFYQYKNVLTLSEKTVQTFYSTCMDEFFLLESNDGSNGIIRYHFDKEMLKIKEFIYSDMKSFGMLMNHILEIYDSYENICFESLKKDFPIEAIIVDYWNNRHEVQFKYLPQRMIRIINIKNCIKSMLDEFAFNNQIIIKINDEFLSENNRIYKINRQKIFETSDGKFDAEIDIEGMSILFTGRKSVSDLIFLGLVKLESHTNIGETIRNLEALFPVCTTDSISIL